jgi:hypothetical protein
MDATPSPYGDDPAARSELAHRSAEAVLRRGREGPGDPPLDLVERLGGLDALAALWQDAEPGTLPATLLTLYLLREWCRGSGGEAARLYRLGSARAEVASVVAGAADPPGPADMLALADAILGSTYRGDLAVALERAAAFADVVAAGRSADASDRAADDPEEATRQLRLARAGTRAAAALRRAARDWRAGQLH